MTGERTSLPVWEPGVPDAVTATPQAKARGPLTSLAPRVVRLVFGLDGRGVRRLLAATVVPTAAACTDPGAGAVDMARTMPVDAATGSSSSGATGAGGAGGFGGTPATGGANAPGGGGAAPAPDAGRDPRIDPDYPFDLPPAPTEDPWTRCTEAIFAELPAEGTPATVAQLCAQPGQEVVTSGWAARVTLARDATNPQRAAGAIAVAPEIAGHVLGVPELTVVDGDFPTMTFTDMKPAGDGFTFQASWQESFDWRTGYRSLGVRVRMRLDCAPTPAAGAARQVETRLGLYLCDESDGARWISVGESCRDCATIAEMAPSPIVPMPRASELPLGGVMRLGIRVMTRVGSDLLLLAEHDRGGTSEYAWSTTAGRIEHVASDVVVWRLPESDPGPQMIQVAAATSDAAGIASLRCHGGGA